MLSTFLRTAAIVCSLLIALSLAFFIVDQTKSSDTQAQQEIKGVLHPVAAPPAKHGQPRRFIDQASHDLTTPFNSIAADKGPWVRHLVPDVLGILLFGLGLGFLARAVQR
jgi:hypothetical protein